MSELRARRTASPAASAASISSRTRSKTPSRAGSPGQSSRRSAAVADASRDAAPAQATSPPRSGRKKPHFEIGAADVAAAADGHAPVSTRGACGSMLTHSFDVMHTHSDPLNVLMADNASILRGYRGRATCQGAIKSVFALHNETINVWSHLAGAILFLILLGHLAVAGVPMPQTDGDIMSSTLSKMADSATSGIGRMYAAAAEAAHTLEEAPGPLGAAMHSLESGLHAGADLAPALDDGRRLTPLEQAAAAGSGGVGASVGAGVGSTSVEPLPLWPVAVFIVSAITCMGASASFHLFQVVDEWWFRLLARIDYAAIAILIVGSAVPFLHYGFFCEPTLLRGYIAADVLTCGACMVFSLADKFQTKEYRFVRMSSFLAAGLFGIIPFTHALLASHEQNAEALYNLIIMGLLYVLGALLYGFRVPERFFPGRFDFVGASHQIFHMMVLMACIVHYFSVIGMYRWRAVRTGCGLPAAAAVDVPVLA